MEKEIKGHTSTPWEHCAKTWYKIDVGLAIENIKDNSIVKCKLANKEYLFNIPNEKCPNISLKMIKNGKWSVYTWAD